jgi:23S rRNA pseudouridine2605 synthase
MTNDGDLAQQLTHPSNQKTKVYEVTLDKPLQPLHQQLITDKGISLDDGPSRFVVTRIDPVRSTGSEQSELGEDKADSSGAMSHLGRGEPLLESDVIYEVTMHEGRNRQIRRTFSALGYEVKTLHRTQFGSYDLNDVVSGVFAVV